MKIVVKPSFSRDVERVNDKELKRLLDLKISQIEKAKAIDNITGLKLLRPYAVHFRIKVENKKHKYRIGAIIRKDTVWLVRFSPRKKIYLQFP